MKNFSYALLLVAIIGLSIAGCKKSDPIAFQGKSSIVFDKKLTNSLSYSFLVNPENEVVVKIPMLINGFATETDRSFEVEVVTDTITTAKPDQYIIQPSVIRAGHYRDSLLLTLKKTEALETSVAHLYLRVKENNEFERGVIESQYYQVSWSNQAIMPTWGVYFRTFFSAVGSTKAFRIFVETTGLTNFLAADFRVYGQAGAEVLGKKFGDYIRKWNAENPNNPLLHDDGTQKGNRIVPVY